MKESTKGFGKLYPPRGTQLGPRKIQDTILKKNSERGVKIENVVREDDRVDDGIEVARSPRVPEKGYGNGLKSPRAKKRSLVLEKKNKNREQGLLRLNEWISEKGYAGASTVDEWAQNASKEATVCDDTIATINAELDKAIDSGKMLGTPNHVQTALTCHALLRLSGACSRFREISAPIVEQVVRSMYSNLEQTPALQDIIERRLPGPEGPGLEVLKALVNQETYYAMFTRLSTKREKLNAELQTWQKLQQAMQKEIMKKQALLQRTTNKWQLSLLTSAFKMWRSVAVARKKQRELLNACFTRLSKAKAKEVFQAWAQIAKQLKKERALEKIRELDGRYQLLEQRKAALDTEIESAQAQLGRWNDKIATLQVDLAHLRSELEESKEENDPILTRKECECRVAMAWFVVSNNIINLEMNLLDQQLNEVKLDEFVDPERLVTEASQLDSLLELQIDEILIRWVNYLVPTVRLENFGSNLADGKVYSMLLSSISNHGHFKQAKFNFENIPKRDFDGLVTQILKSLQQEKIPSLITFDDIRNGVADKNFVFLTYLFCNYPCMTSKKESWGEARKILEQGRLEQESFFDFVQRNSILELAVEKAWENFSTRVEEVRRKVRWALRERDQKMNLWVSIRKRMRQAAWAIMLDRVRGDIVEIPDRKQTREMQEFTTISDYSSSREEEAISTILAGEFNILKQVFSHYRKFTLNDMDADLTVSMKANRLKNGAVLLLHVHGFLLFCKDIKIIGKNTLSVLEVYKILLEQEMEGDRMDPKLFVRCLVVLADEVFDGQSSAANLRKLFKDNICPFAGVTKCQELRDLAWQTTEVTEVLRSRSDELHALFYTLCNQLAGKEEEPPEGVRMTTYTKLRHGYYELGLIASAGTFTQGDFDSIAKSLTVENGYLMFHDVIEFLMASVMYLEPNPLVPFPVRLKTALDNLNLK